MKNVILIDYINMFIHEYNSVIKYNRRERIKDKSIYICYKTNEWLHSKRKNKLKYKINW